MEPCFLEMEVFVVSGLQCSSGVWWAVAFFGNENYMAVSSASMSPLWLRAVGIYA